MMKKVNKVIRNWLSAFLYPKPIIGVLFLPRFVKHLLAYTKASNGEAIPILDMQPCLGDWVSSTPFDAHYFYQGAWLSRGLAAKNVKHHLDIASSVTTISVLSAHVNVTFLDYRPLEVNLPGLNSIAGDILKLPFDESSQSSVSCLHVIEHIGLGRYGDAINPNGTIDAANELQRIVSKSGYLYISLPIGKERVCFNAHRVHAPSTVVNLFPQMKLVSFSYVDDVGEFYENRTLVEAENLDYGCGLFCFRKT